MARGWCSKHYARWKMHGDPEKLLREYGVYRRLRPNGYVDLWVPGHPMARSDGYAFEHRVMAWDAGLLTDPAMQVHHLNEIKHDNRLDNFEIKAIDVHTRDHISERGTITNQFGTFSLRSTRGVVTCSVDNCEKLAACRGWCPMHYQRWRTTGSLDLVR